MKSHHFDIRLELTSITPIKLCNILQQGGLYIHEIEMGSIVRYFKISDQ